MPSRPRRDLDSSTVPLASASLYRRHRPRSFADVVGQPHVVRTLSNAIQQDRVHHAYLFVGSRGTGKTSMAKILAASLNCVNGPTTEPCGVCESCVAIASATSLDVIEMDAASNNSVDDIRELREKVAYAPVSGRHKVYILDEAHMLTPAAWNAFLKTLEEPPPHTIFVLATTEAAKVLPTVVDRCHRFDFARPSVAQIASVLRRVADAESIEVPDEATALIARSATGSFRDALGTLQQLLAYSGPSIALEDVLAVLGAADADLLFGAVDAVDAGDARAALQACARLAESGRDVGRFFGDLEAHARALMVVQALGGEVAPELQVTAEQDERLREQAARVSPGDVVRLLDLLADGLRAMKDGSEARTQLELALVKAAVPSTEASIRALMTRIERLEARIANGAGVAAAEPASRAPDVPATAAGRGRTSVAVTSHAEGRPPVSVSTTLPGTPAEGPEQAARLAGRAAQAASEQIGASAPGEPEATVAAVAVIEPAAPAPEPSIAVAVGLDLASLTDLWPAVVQSAESDNRLVGAVLAKATPTGLEGNELTLALTGKTDRALAEDPVKRDLIAKAVRAVTGSSLRLAYELRADGEAEGHGAPALSEDELIERFVTEFEAEELPPEPKSEETS